MKVSEPSPSGEGNTLLSCMRSDSEAVMKLSMKTCGPGIVPSAGFYAPDIMFREPEHFD